MRIFVIYVSSKIYLKLYYNNWRSDPIKLIYENHIKQIKFATKYILLEAVIHCYFFECVHYDKLYI